MSKNDQTAMTVVDRDRTLAILQPMLANLPTVEDDPTAAMVQVIAAAESPQEWEALFNAASAKANVGRSYQVRAIRWLPSEYPDGVGFFLVCDAIDLETGEATALTTGSTVGMAQLLTAHVKGWLPLDVEILEKATETRAGYKPMRFKALPKKVSAEV